MPSAINIAPHKLTDEQISIEIEDFNLFYGHTQVLFDISMRIAKQRVTAFIGPSGCGKSSYYANESFE